MNYSNRYHAACNYLIAFGAHGPRRAEARRTIAGALWDLRHAHGRERARRERMHLLFISGMFPTKDEAHHAA